ncbi:MAG TPA: DUF3300 domain-containing protein [Opitutaceae bacterium]|jgi:hypothetical protein|nr:DUF3300 domain-containing protein [Opitutaceae bacterium]
MPLRKALFPSVCVLAALASQSCVAYLPPDNPPPPPTQAYNPPQEQQPPPPQPAPPPQQPAYYPAQYTEAAPPAPPSQPSPNPALDDLVAPIALYPDPLIALILPASTVPGDVSAASNYLVQYGDQSQINNQPWDPSVRALAHYPTVIAWMASNMDWTQALGSAFSSDPNSVMDAVQRLRARAQAAGTLASTPQQEVLGEGGDIEIVPAQDNVIYVPVYDPEVVYSANPYYGYSGPFINFGEPCPAGIWLSYSFDWRSHRVWAGDREREGWRQSHTGGGPPQGAHSWHPPAGTRAVAPPARNHGNRAPMPHPMPGAPNPPPEHYKRPVTNNVQTPANQPVSHNYPAPQERPRLNAQPHAGPANPQRQQVATPGQQGPARVVLPPTNHGESVPTQRYAEPTRQQAPAVEHSARPAPARPETYISPSAPPHAMPEHPSQPAREPRTQSAPARSAPPPPPPQSAPQVQQKQN